MLHLSDAAVLRKKTEDMLEVIVGGVGAALHDCHYGLAERMCMRGYGATSLADDLGIFDEDQLCLWNHRLKHGRMNVTKKELRQWL